MTRSWSSYLMTALFLLLTGVVAGLVIAVVGLALAAAFASLAASGGSGLMDFLYGTFSLFFSVLAVSIHAAPDALWAGVITAAAISLVYGVIYFLLPQLLFRGGWLALILAVTGAIVAPLSLRGLLVDYQVAAVIIGALFGLIAAFALSRRLQSVPVAHSA